MIITAGAETVEPVRGRGPAAVLHGEGRTREGAFGDGGVPASAVVGQVSVFPAPRRSVRSTCTSPAKTETSGGARWRGLDTAARGAVTRQAGRACASYAKVWGSSGCSQLCGAQQGALTPAHHRPRFDHATSSRRRPRDVVGRG